MLVQRVVPQWQTVIITEELMHSNFMIGKIMLPKFEHTKLHCGGVNSKTHVLFAFHRWSLGFRTSLPEFITFITFIYYNWRK